MVNVAGETEASSEPRGQEEMICMRVALSHCTHRSFFALNTRLWIPIWVRVHAFPWAQMCYVCRQTSLREISFFAPAEAAAAKAAKTTKRGWDGRKHKQSASNLLLQSTLKIPTERSYLFQSITGLLWRNQRRKESKANCRNLHPHSGRSTAHAAPAH